MADQPVTDPPPLDLAEVFAGIDAGTLPAIRQASERCVGDRHYVSEFVLEDDATHAGPPRDRSEP